MHFATGALAATLIFGPIFAAPKVTHPPAQANEEVRLVVASVERHHPDPFHDTSKRAFYAQVDELLAREGQITSAQQYFGLAKLLSMVSDTHTQLHTTDETPDFQSTFPIRFRLFSDGLYVIAANDSYRDAIGTRVVSISGRDPADVIEELAHYSFSDSWPRKRVFAEMHLYVPETYDYFDLREEHGGAIELELESRGGSISKMKLDETWEKGLNDFGWATLNPFIPDGLMTVHDLRDTEPPRYLQNLQDNISHRFLDEGQKHLYLQINKQQEQEGGPESVDELLEFAGALWNTKTVELVILDLRNDPGGNILIGNFISGVLPEMGFNLSNLQAIAVLQGTDTVSAGPILIAQLEQTVLPILIGEPSGSAPNMFLNAHKFTLPYSKIEVEVSQMRRVTTTEADTRRYIAPDLPIARTFEDYASGRDPALELAKTVDQEMVLEFYAGYFTQPWARPSQAELAE